MRRVRVVAAVLVTVVVAGGVALAAIPDSDGSVTVCYALPNGNMPDGGPLYPIDSSQSCAAGQKRLVLGRTGPTGPAGPTGAAGGAGPTGTAADSGPPLTIYSGDWGADQPQRFSPWKYQVAVPAGVYHVEASWHGQAQVKPCTEDTCIWTTSDTAQCSIQPTSDASATRHAAGTAIAPSPPANLRSYQLIRFSLEPRSYVTLDRPGHITLECGVVDFASTQDGCTFTNGDDHGYCLTAVAAHLSAQLLEPRTSLDQQHVSPGASTQIESHPRRKLGPKLRRQQARAERQSVAKLVRKQLRKH